MGSAHLLGTPPNALASDWLVFLVRTGFLRTYGQGGAMETTSAGRPRFRPGSGHCQDKLCVPYFSCSSGNPKCITRLVQLGKMPLPPRPASEYYYLWSICTRLRPVRSGLSESYV